MFHSTVVKVSGKQMSKLRNGHKVRVKPPDIEGEGCYVIVNPINYDIINRTFSKKKGLELMLSPEEIQANKMSYSSPEQHQSLLQKHKVGSGIFGRKFDKFIEKKIGKNAKKELYGVAREFLPLAQAGLTAGLTTAGTALGAVQPELIPFIAPGVASLSTLGSDYLANPSKYQKIKSSSLASEYAKNLALQKMNDQLGTNMGNLSSASIQSALANKATADLDKLAIQQKYFKPPQQLTEMDLQAMYGNGLYAGGGLGVGLYASKSGGAVGLNGGFVRSLPPALQSQPFSANFQFQHTLPPAYQKFSKGAGIYT